MMNLQVFIVSDLFSLTLYSVILKRETNKRIFQNFKLKCDVNWFSKQQSAKAFDRKA